MKNGNHCLLPAVAVVEAENLIRILNYHQVR